jgi:Large extracellular alpha-helical protein
MPANGPEVAELALAWALARIWPDHPARPKLARALVEHRQANRFGNTLKNALFLMLAESQSKQAKGPGTVAVLADDIQLLSATAWPDAGKVLDRVWPLAEFAQSFFKGASNSPGRFLLQAHGEGELFYSVDATFPTKDPETALDHGLVIETHLRDPVHPRGDESETGAGEILALDIVLQARLHQSNVAIDVPLPAGLEAINPDLPVESLAVGPNLVAYSDFAYEHQEQYAERVLIFPRLVRQGVARHTVFLRALIPGTYQIPNLRVEVMYNPEIRGRGRTSRLTILPAASPYTPTGGWSD